MQAAVEQAAAADGGLRIAVCCAGIGWAQKVAGSKGPHPLLPFETTIQINLIGTFNVLRFAATAMIATEPLEDGERGVCVNTASVAAFDGQIGQIAYSASKGGIVGMTLPAARDLAQQGIRVNTIAPGLFDTPLLAALPEEARQKLGAGVPFPQRLGTPAEYAQLACSHRREPDAQRRGHPPRRRSAHAPALSRKASRTGWSPAMSMRRTFRWSPSQSTDEREHVAEPVRGFPGPATPFGTRA